MTTHDFEGSASHQTRPEIETTIAIFGDDSDISEENEHEKLSGKVAFVNPTFAVKLKVNGSKA